MPHSHTSELPCPFAHLHTSHVQSCYPDPFCSALTPQLLYMTVKLRQSTFDKQSLQENHLELKVINNKSTA